MRNFVSIFSISAFLLLLWQCNPMFESKEDATARFRPTNKVVLDSEKQNLAEELRDCSDNMGRRLQAISEQMEITNAGARKSLKELRSRLTKEKRKVDHSLNEIEKSSAESWAIVKTKSDKILTEAKIETQKIEEIIEDLKK